VACRPPAKEQSHISALTPKDVISTYEIYVHRSHLLLAEAAITCKYLAALEGGSPKFMIDASVIGGRGSFL